MTYLLHQNSSRFEQRLACLKTSCCHLNNEKLQCNHQLFLVRDVFMRGCRGLCRGTFGTRKNKIGMLGYMDILQSKLGKHPCNFAFRAECLQRRYGLSFVSQKTQRCLNLQQTLRCTLKLLPRSLLKERLNIPCIAQGMVTLDR
jgi:hypothetical protein